MQDYRRLQFDEDDRRHEGGRQRSDSDRSWRDQGDGGYTSPRRGEGQGPHGGMDDARHAEPNEGWRGDDDRGMRGGWRGEDDRWPGRASQRDYGQYGPGGSRESGQFGRGSSGGWGHEWGGYSGGRSGGDWSGGSYGAGRDFAPSASAHFTTERAQALLE